MTKEDAIYLLNKSCGWFTSLSDKFKSDKEVVMIAVKGDGRILKYVSYELRGDKEVVMAAIGNDGRAYYYCSPSMQRNRDVINFSNKKLKRFGQIVEDYLCDELIELKKKYGVDTLEVALEIEAAEIEARRTHFDGVVSNCTVVCNIKKDYKCYGLF